MSERGTVQTESLTFLSTLCAEHVYSIANDRALHFFFVLKGRARCRLTPFFIFSSTRTWLFPHDLRKIPSYRVLCLLVSAEFSRVSQAI